MIELSGITLNIGNRVALRGGEELWLDAILTGIAADAIPPVLAVTAEGSTTPIAVPVDKLGAEWDLYLPCGGCKGTLLRIKPLGPLPASGGWPYTRKLNGKPLCADCTDEIMDAEQAADEERAR